MGFTGITVRKQVLTDKLISTEKNSPDYKYAMDAFKKGGDLDRNGVIDSRELDIFKFKQDPNKVRINDMKQKQSEAIINAIQAELNSINKVEENSKPKIKYNS